MESIVEMIDWNVTYRTIRDYQHLMLVDDSIFSEQEFSQSSGLAGRWINLKRLSFGRRFKRWRSPADHCEPIPLGAKVHGANRICECR